MSEVEQELLKATSFAPKKKYAERQDYLAAVARASISLEDDVFYALSAGAGDWCNEAVAALREKKDIPEFPDVEFEAEEAVVDEATQEMEVKAESEPEKPKRRRKGQPARRLEHPPITLPEDIDDTPFEMDKWGCTIGSKNAAAAGMMEKGCRMADIKVSIGGTYYNLIERLEKQGHTVERGTNGMLTLKHKDGL